MLKKIFFSYLLASFAFANSITVRFALTLQPRCFVKLTPINYPARPIEMRELINTEKRYKTIFEDMKAGDSIEFLTWQNTNYRGTQVLKPCQKIEITEALDGAVIGISKIAEPTEEVVAVEYKYPDTKILRTLR
jgi:hypothetical protein